MDDTAILRKRGYTLRDKLGEGTYAKVWSAYSVRFNREVAIKIINKNKAPPHFLEKFLPRELQIVESLNHPNIVKVFEMFETANKKVYMIMELGEKGDLLELIKARGSLPEDFSRKLFRQLSLAIKFVHDLHITHRDLKCENLLLDKSFNLKVSDFGFSKRMTYSQAGHIALSNTFCGSAAYASPEVLQGIPYNPKMYDIWSMGVILFIMITGLMPYDDSNIRKMVKIQTEHHIAYPPAKNIKDECKDLIHHMLHPDVAMRIDIDGILSHPWLQPKLKTQNSTSRQEDPPIVTNVPSTIKTQDENEKLNEDPRSDSAPKRDRVATDGNKGCPGPSTAIQK